MKVTAILGSRNREGKTAEATNALLNALKANGATIVSHYLPELKLESCRMCDHDGWGQCRSTGTCVIEDDLERLVEEIRSSEIAVFATPVYYGDLSECMKVFTDRLRRISATRIGPTGENPNFIPTIGICNAGGGGGGSEQCATNLKKVLATSGFEVIDMVPVRRQNMTYKIRSLAEMGEWLPDYVASGEWERVIPRPRR